MAEWRVYGCGSVSSNRSLQSSYEFVDGNARLQVDMGNGAIYHRCKVEGDIRSVLDSISHLVITHGHHDHTVDLARHIVAWKYTPGYSPGYPVHVYLTEESKTEIQNLIDSSGFKGIFEEIYIPHIIEPGQSFFVDGLQVTPFYVEHMEGTIGVNILTQDGVKVTITSDTRYFESLSSNFHGTDLLVTEASFLDNTHPMHLTLKEAAEVASEANAKNLLLVHFYPEMEARTEEEIRQIASQWYSGNVFCAQDGLALSWDAQARSWQPRMMF